MNRTRQKTIRVLTTLLVATTGVAVAEDLDINWQCVGGGEMWSTGGAYVVAGTIGQPDADAMTGGVYSVTGGFWSLPACWCPSDVNNDGMRNGLDVQEFVACFVEGGFHCFCADVVPDGVLDAADVTTFVSGLLEGGACL